MGSLYPDRSVLVFADANTVNSLKPVFDRYEFEIIQVQSLQLIAGHLNNIQPQLVVVDCEHPAYSEDSLQLFFERLSNSRNIPFLILTGTEDPGLEIIDDTYLNVDVVDKNDADQLGSSMNLHLQSSVIVTFWGVRGSIPSPNREHMVFGGNTTCLQIESPLQKNLIIFDCGTGIRNLGNDVEKYLDNRADGHLFITHPHWDHIQGFPFFKPFYNGDNSFTIHMPEQFRGGTKDVLSGHMTKTFFPVTLDMFASEINYVTQEEELVDYGSFSIEYLVANHPTKTAMYKVHIGGSNIIFAPDNELGGDLSPLRFMNKFEEFIDGTDLLIHDAQYDRESYRLKEGWGHSAWEDVVDIARRNNVERLYLTHHDPDSTDEKLEVIDEQLQQYKGAPFREIELAKEKLVVKLPIHQEKGVADRT